MIEFLNRNYKLILFGALLFFSISYGIEILNGGHAWKTGDWLINYSGGFIRRGLLGSFFTSFFSSHETLLWGLYLFKVVIYFILFYSVIAIYQAQSRESYFVFLILAPAYLLFPFYDMVGAFRKEILVLLTFTIFCLFYIKRSISSLKLFVFVLLFVLLGLNHEIVVFTSSFFMYMMYLSFKDSQISKTAFIVGVLSLDFASVLLLFISSQYRGDGVAAEAICQELRQIGFGGHICSGSIEWLSDSPEAARLKVVESLDIFPYLSVLGLILALLPALLIGFRKKVHFYLLSVSFIAFLPLYFFALDWGRWIYIYSFFISTIVLVENNAPSFKSSSILIFLGLIYLTTWSLPHCCTGSLNLGLLGVLLDYPQKIIHHVSLLI